MASLGEYLRRERELRGIALQDISNKTNIRLIYLQAIESNSYDVLPAEPFLKGFLRAYATTIGIDPEEVILLYKENLSAATDDKLAIPKEILSARPAIGKKKALIFTAIIAIGAIMAISLVGNFMKEKSQPTAKDSAKSSLQTAVDPKEGLAQKGLKGMPSELQRATIVANPSEAELQRETIITADEL